MNAHLKKLLLLALLVGIAVTALPARSMAIGEEGTFSVAPEFGFYGADRKAINSFFTMGASGHYFVMDGLSVGAEALAYSFYQNKDYGGHGYSVNPWAFGFNGLVRFYPVHSDTMGFFIGTGIGGLFSGDRIPYYVKRNKRGYDTNVTLPVDLGFAVNVTDTVAIELVGRYQRIGFSDRGYDAWGGHAGVRFTF
jgi:hypothetical protein